MNAIQMVATAIVRSRDVPGMEAIVSRERAFRARLGDDAGSGTSGTGGAAFSSLLEPQVVVRAGQAMLSRGMRVSVPESRYR
jgi:hypothetical protein